MSTALSEQRVRFREFRFEDIPALVDLLNQTFPDTPTTVETEAHFEKSYPPDNPRLRFAVETNEGRFIGMGACLKPFWVNAPGVYHLWGLVDAEWRRQGIGRALLAELEPFAREHQATRLWSDCREDFDFAIRFFEQAGFSNFGLRFESKLDLTNFDESRFADAIDRVLDAGFQLSTLAAERSTNPNADHVLYELDHATRQDVPLPGGAVSNMSYDDFRKVMLESPDADPTAVIIAKHSQKYVGLTALWLPQEGPAYTNMTGILREYRERGLALALKLLSIRVMKTRGYAEARTTNDTANPAILRLNEKLGYQPLPGWLQWEKTL
ncbi:MAG TPA: GNAT family N-acetyltransferase [Anaerolineae bacterium]|nr:GNAT family N-acetyltransferase [Anaerolineae bacterium]